MAIIKTISQYSEVTTVEQDDKFILERADGSFKSIKQENMANGIIKVTLTLSSAQILALFTTPIEFCPAQGAGTYLWPVGEIGMKNNYGTATYVSGNPLRLKYTGDPVDRYIYTSDSGFITATATEQQIMYFATNYLNMLENTALEVFVPVANPTTGDGTFTLEGLFKVFKF